MASYVAFCWKRRLWSPTTVKHLCTLEKLTPVSFIQIPKRQNRFERRNFCNSLERSNSLLKVDHCGNKLFGRSLSNRDKYNFFVRVIKETKPALVKVQSLANIPFFTVPVGAGSGFIVESNGIIVTNAHVVGKSRYIGVRLYDGNKYEAKVIGLDLVRDIAVLKINAKNLPIIAMSKMTDIEVGEWVLALGSPFSLKNTVTVGIVSNIHRAGSELGLQDEKSDLGYIQTDATINFGNSGGPLLNLDGECVGMNTMMASIGIAFALPSAHVADFMQQVKESRSGCYNEVRRYLGVRMWTLSPEFIETNRLELPNLAHVEQGIYVMYVEPASPAADAGMKVNDIIVAIDGEPVIKAEEVVHAVQTKDSFVITVSANEEEFDLLVEVDIDNTP